MQVHYNCRTVPAHAGLVMSTVYRYVTRRHVAQGERIFSRTSPVWRAYTVTAGEVLIVRDGLPVDLVGAGELLDPRFWPGATALAHTDCTLALRPTA